MHLRFRTRVTHVGQVFRVPSPSDTADTLATRPLYNTTNAFFTSHSLASLVNMIKGDEAERMRERVTAIQKQYTGLSETYQGGKGRADIPLA